MSLRTRHRTPFGWLTLLVFLLQALWPLAVLAAPVGAPAWMEVCTATGTRLVPLGDGADPGSLPAAKGDHCPLCAVPTGVDQEPTPNALQLPVLPRGTPSLAATTASALPAEPFAGARPRAPPVAG